MAYGQNASSFAPVIYSMAVHHDPKRLQKYAWYNLWFDKCRLSNKLLLTDYVHPVVIVISNRVGGQLSIA